MEKSREVAARWQWIDTIRKRFEDLSISEIQLRRIFIEIVCVAGSVSSYDGYNHA
jgi:hypothetical protein